MIEGSIEPPRIPTSAAYLAVFGGNRRIRNAMTSVLEVLATEAEVVWVPKGGAPLDLMATLQGKSGWCVFLPGPPEKPTNVLDLGSMSWGTAITIQQHGSRNEWVRRVLSASIVSGIGNQVFSVPATSEAPLAPTLASLFHDIRCMRGIETLSTRKRLARIVLQPFSDSLFRPLGRCLSGRFIRQINDAPAEAGEGMGRFLGALHGKPEWQLQLPTSLDRLWYDLCEGFHVFFRERGKAGIDEMELELRSALEPWATEESES